MFSAHHPLAAHGWHEQRHAQFPPCCATQAVSVGGGLFLHGAIVVQQDGARIPNSATVSVYSMNFWPGTNTPKSSGNAFTARPPSLFADDKSEKAKATLARKDAHYGQSTGAVAHGHTVMPGLSAKAQKRLKAVPYSQPIAPRTTGLPQPYRAKVGG